MPSCLRQPMETGPLAGDLVAGEAASPRRWRAFGALLGAALLGVGALGFAGSASAQNYESWGDTAADPSKQMVEELKELIDRAERDRAANPQFLKDLRAVLGQYDRPWQTLVLADNFADRDFTQNPTWTVAQGKFYIDYSNGLRSLVKPPAASTGSTQTKDVAAALLSALLTPSGQQQAGAARAEIFVKQKIANAFNLQVKLASIQAPGRLDLLVFQGDQRNKGYMLTYLPGQAEALQLLRLTTSGSAVVETAAEPVRLEDGQVHALDWQRFANGDMAVALDGRELFRVNDRGFKDTFSGLAIVNSGGDYSVREVALYAAQ